MSIAHINLIYRLSVLGGSREIYPPRILHRQRLLPAFADSSFSGCRAGGVYGYCAESLQTVALLVLPAAGFCGTDSDLHGVDWNLLYTDIKKLECWSIGVMEY